MDAGVLVLAYDLVPSIDKAVPLYSEHFSGDSFAAHDVDPGLYTLFIRGSRSEWFRTPVYIDTESVDLGVIDLVPLPSSVGIRGRITDQDGRGISGASVTYVVASDGGPAFVDTVELGTTTDQDGAFSIFPIDREVLIEVSAVGYTGAVQVVHWGQELDISLEAGELTLDPRQ